jgi:hypothetical protein
MWNTSEYDDLGRVCASTAINCLRTETLFTGRADGGGTVTVLVDPSRSRPESATIITPTVRAKLTVRTFNRFTVWWERTTAGSQNMT